MNKYTFYTIVLFTVVFCVWYGLQHHYFTGKEVKQDFNHALNHAIDKIPGK